MLYDISDAYSLGVVLLRLLTGAHCTIILRNGIQDNT